jgi:hypothetical protein
VHLSGVDYSQDASSFFYIAGIQSYFSGPGLYRFDSPHGTEVNIGDQRDIYLPDDFRKGSSIGTRGNSNSHKLAAGLDKLIYLPYAPPDVDGRHLRHRLDDDRRRRADYNLPNPDLFRLSSFDHIKIVACFRLASKLKYARRPIGD